MIYGEHCWGGHAEYGDRPGAQRAQTPGDAHVGGVRGVPAGLPHRLSHAAPCPLQPATPCSSSASARVCRARRWRWARMMGARVEVTSRSEQKRAAGARHGRRGGARQRRREVAGRGRRRRRERRPGDLGAVGAGTEGRRAPGGVRQHVGSEGRADPAAAVLQAVRDHRLDDGQLPGVRRGLGPRRSRVCAITIDRTYPLDGLPGCARPARAGRAARQDRA